ncbi:antiterminator Q family protein, partial [Escherichia coli]|uniref:antiterminator Q family protein n=1 Tax=Escherichia coli TaxID=562 RepID=UPI003D35DF09
SIKNDGHYFCRAGGNRPDGLNEPVTYELIIAHFVIGISLRTIARRYKCSDGTIRKNIQLTMGVLLGLSFYVQL